jgi:phosphoribosyl 1,2-cyclic phosphate phosphodiesterase
MIDCGRDFRIQALHHDITHVDCVLITHTHFDHITGIDDLRVFTQKTGQTVSIFGKIEHLEYLKKYIYHYLFDDNTQRGGGLAELQLIPVKGPFVIEGVQFQPLPVLHGNMEIFGYKFLRCAYISDVSLIPAKTMQLLQDIDLLIIDALRFRHHTTHFNLQEALEVVESLKPKMSYFTHICHDMSHRKVQSLLDDPESDYYTPQKVQLAYDGLSITIPGY